MKKDGTTESPGAAKTLAIGEWRLRVGGGGATIKQFSVRTVKKGLILRQGLDGGFAEVYQGFHDKPKNLVRLRIPSVFGKPKVITIGGDWIQLGDRVFRATPVDPGPKDS